MLVVSKGTSTDLPPAAAQGQSFGWPPHTASAISFGCPLKVSAAKSWQTLFMDNWSSKVHSSLVLQYVGFIQGVTTVTSLINRMINQRTNLQNRPKGSKVLIHCCQQIRSKGFTSNDFGTHLLSDQTPSSACSLLCDLWPPNIIQLQVPLIRCKSGPKLNKGRMDFFFQVWAQNRMWLMWRHRCLHSANPVF